MADFFWISWWVASHIYMYIGRCHSVTMASDQFDIKREDPNEVLLQQEPKDSLPFHCSQTTTSSESHDTPQANASSELQGTPITLTGEHKFFFIYV